MHQNLPRPLSWHYLQRAWESASEKFKTRFKTDYDRFNETYVDNNFKFTEVQRKVQFARCLMYPETKFQQKFGKDIEYVPIPSKLFETLKSNVREHKIWYKKLV